MGENEAEYDAAVHYKESPEKGRIQFLGGGVGERVLSSISDPIREIGELQNIIMKILI